MHDHAWRGFRTPYSDPIKMASQRHHCDKIMAPVTRLGGSMPLFARPLIVMLAVLAAPAAELFESRTQEKSDDGGWKIPPNAASETNPIARSEEVIEKGKRLYESKCQRCHGRDGRGRGPDADPDTPAGNLTDPLRAAFNPDGVMFYKIWNGRESPAMPAFRREGLTRDEAWTIIHYVKTLRK